VQSETHVGLFQFRLLQRLLRDNGSPAKLGSRALDILVALVKAAGEMVSNAELRACACHNDRR
jgi:DNA-binding winged helix-turn-helix (wHTH) protein